MIGTSFLDLIAIRTAIALLRSITPLSIIYTLSLPFLPARFLTPTAKILSIYPICESAFYFFVYLPRKHSLQGAPEHPPLKPPNERKQLLKRILNTVPDHAGYLRLWFLGADLNDIKTENLKEFLRWSLFNSSGSWSEESGDAVEEAEIDEYVGMVEDTIGHKFEEGRGKAQCYRLTVDEVRMKHRPLLWYLIIGFIDILAYIRLTFSGFKYHRKPLSTLPFSFPFRLETLLSSHTTPARSSSSSLPYWLRPHRSNTQSPILYIHGIGIGLHPYIPTLIALSKASPDVGILAVEIDPISARICSSMPRKAEMLEDFRTILNSASGYDKRFVLAANSYGTVISTHLLHDAEISKRIKEVVLIDPVTLLLHLPDVAYNFLRRKPRRANEHMLHYFASTDPGIAHTLCRRFFWAENILWKEDLKGKKVTVWLSERDLIVDTGNVRRYLTGGFASRQPDEEEGGEEFGGFVDGECVVTDDEGGRIKVVWCEGMDHAQVFDEKKWYTRLVKEIADAAASGDASA
ncbi:hypothetical protein ABW19_dt0200503 [Dactylella cylindrospora]|nr:hypothetical protein ABW19_dt0200503 [Dactylella cylindrospora]